MDNAMKRLITFFLVALPLLLACEKPTQKIVIPIPDKPSGQQGGNNGNNGGNRGPRPNGGNRPMGGGNNRGPRHNGPRRPRRDDRRDDE